MIQLLQCFEIVQSIANLFLRHPQPVEETSAEVVAGGS